MFRGERAAAGPVSVEVVALQRLALLAEGRVLAVVRSTQGGGPAQRRGPRPAPRGPATQGGAAGHSRPAATRGTGTVRVGQGQVHELHGGAVRRGFPVGEGGGSRQGARGRTGARRQERSLLLAGAAAFGVDIDPSVRIDQDDCSEEETGRHRRQQLEG